MVEMRACCWLAMSACVAEALAPGDCMVCKSLFILPRIVTTLLNALDATLVTDDV